jgi:hypothetical protein
MDNQTLVYELAAKYIQSGTGGNGDFNYFRDHLVSHPHANGLSFYKVGQDGGAEYYLACSARGTLYKRIVRRSYRIHMDIHNYHQLLHSDNAEDEQKAFDSEEELISEEIIPLMYSSQIGFIGIKDNNRSHL